MDRNMAPCAVTWNFLQMSASYSEMSHFQGGETRLHS